MGFPEVADLNSSLTSMKTNSEGTSCGLSWRSVTLKLASLLHEEYVCKVEISVVSEGKEIISSEGIWRKWQVGNKKVQFLECVIFF